MNSLTPARSIHIVLDQRFGVRAGQHRGARISAVRDAERGLICAHADLLPGDMMPGYSEEERARHDEDALIYTACAYFVDLRYSEAAEPGTWHWIEPA